MPTVHYTGLCVLCILDFFYNKTFKSQQCHEEGAAVHFTDGEVGGQSVQGYTARLRDSSLQSSGHWGLATRWVTQVPGASGSPGVT